MFMKRIVLALSLFAAVGIASLATGCKTQKAGPVASNNPVPTNAANNDSTGTTPGVSLTPAPIPNVRPNPVPNPLPPSPPM